MSTFLKYLLAVGICGTLAACGGSDYDDPPPPPPPPAAPSTLSVEPGDATTVVQWPAVSSATSYTLYKSTTTPVVPSAATVVTGAVSPYVDTSVTNGATVYYAVVAVSPDGVSAMSTEVGATPVAPVPAAPTTLNATPGDRMVTLDWTPSSRADSYNVYWSTSANVTPGAAGVNRIEDIQATSYAHVGLANGTSYYYVVTAVSTGGESTVSVADSATPQPPAPGALSNLTATPDDEQVRLSWTASSDATSYNVYWSLAPGIVIGQPAVTKIAGITSSSYTHTGLTNGTTYYYAVSAEGPGGEGNLSNEVSARPLPPPPPAPLGVTAVAPKDVIEVRLQWFDVTDYPNATAPIQLSYNVYRGLQPGVATYYKDATRATKFADVTAPLVDASVSRATTYYYVVTSFVPGLPEVESVPSGEVAATTGRAGTDEGGGGGGGSGGHDEGFGNNLSFPLIYADGYGLTGVKVTGTWQGVGPFGTLPSFDFNTGLRPLSTEVLTAFPLFSSTTAVSIGGTVYYPQKTESTWQAEWRNNAQGAPIDVIVDWGDALLSRTYRTNSIIRVETTLKQDATVPGVTDTMTAYKMSLLSGSGITELQGTDKSIYASAARNVYAINARLKIEKIVTSGGGDIVIFDKAIYETFGTTEEGGPPAGTGGGATAVSKFGAEINVGGSVVYGYNFRLSSVTGVQDKTGQYRITFSLDPNAKIGTNTTVPGHVTMIEKADAAATLSSDGKSSSVIVTVN